MIISLKLIYTMLLKSHDLARYTPTPNDENNLSEQAQRLPHEGKLGQQESPKAHRFRAGWATQSHQLKIKHCHVFALKRGLPGSLQAGNCLITEALASTAVLGRDRMSTIAAQ